MAEVTELVTRFSFKGSLEPLKGYNASLGKSIGLLVGMTSAIAATGAAVSKWASGILESIDPLEQLTRQTGESIAFIQELGFAASQSGSDLSAVTGTVESLSQKIGEAAQKGSEDFSRLGISVRDAGGQVKSAEVILEEVRQRFRQLNLSMSEQRSFAEALGIDASLLQLLNKSSAEIDGLRARARELGVLNEEQADQAASYKDSLEALRFAMDGVKQLIAVGLAPQLKELVEGFTDVIAANKEWVVDAIAGGMEFISEFMDLIGRIAPVLAVVAAGFVAAKISALGFAGVMGIILSPVVVITGAIAALILLVDDLIVAFQGGDSVIAKLFQNLFGIDIQPFLQDMVDKVTNIFALIKNIITGEFGEAWENAKQLFFDMLGVIGGPAGAIAKFFLSNDEQPGRLEPGVNAGGTTSNSSVEQNVNIEVRTNDPERAGKSVADNLQNQMQDAQTQARRGGR